MGKLFGGLGLVLLFGAFLLVQQIVYIVNEKEQAIVLRFGEPVIQRPEAGLYFKAPFIDDMVKLDKRNLEFDLPEALSIQTGNEELLMVDAFIRYQITDPLLYYQSFNGGSQDFNRFRRLNGDVRIRELLTSNLRNVLGGVSINDIITTRRVELMNEIQKRTSEQANRFGITIIDLRIKRADFPDENAARVYARMQSEYNFEAERLRAEGDEEAQKIRAEADSQVAEIKAEGEQRSQEIRGEADGERNAIFNAAYSRDPEFFDFYRSMLAYEKALSEGTGETTYVLSPDSEFFRYFNTLRGAQ